MSNAKTVANDAKLMQEWSFDKNNEIGLDPHELVVGSRKKAWWKCSTCGHEWFRTYTCDKITGVLFADI